MNVKKVTIDLFESLGACERNTLKINHRFDVRSFGKLSKLIKDLSKFVVWKCGKKGEHEGSEHQSIQYGNLVNSHITAVVLV